MENYKPPFTITNKILEHVSSISEKSDVLFEYKQMSTWEVRGKLSGESIVVSTDGFIVHREFVFDQEDPSLE